ncbi:hypothetical protein Bbelb_173560 [Branchiostoma belcheri]|nr:hypothetical protein Bbelb_173560 [Branchiostoma belcheri]
MKCLHSCEKKDKTRCLSCSARFLVENLHHGNLSCNLGDGQNQVLLSSVPIHAADCENQGGGTITTAHRKFDVSTNVTSTESIHVSYYNPEHRPTHDNKNVVESSSGITTVNVWVPTDESDSNLTMAKGVPISQMMIIIFAVTTSGLLILMIISSRLLYLRLARSPRRPDTDTADA